ncbi:MAG: hypothetical protein NC084_02490 [Bacteroides sp.]|nr:hypothetical protein [Eubacterium sp.]MCM1418414.1 hypothetical protein [Roseburia sp.]MCM1461564.1 hypothetical protein [Bacteroides sp.]
MTCTFFGHRDAPSSLRDRLKDVLRELIETRGADLFYVGNHGSFDRMATSALYELSAEYPSIRCYTVLAYLPDRERAPGELPTVFPEGIKLIPKRYAISYRNRFMVEQSDTVISYITYSFGGAAKFTELARRKGKTVINLATLKRG